MRTLSLIQSDINRVNAQIEQLKNSSLFKQEHRDVLLPEYKRQLEKLTKELEQQS